MGRQAYPEKHFMIFQDFSYIATLAMPTGKYKRRTLAIAPPKPALDFSEHDKNVMFSHLPPARRKTLPACRKKYLRHILNYL